MRSLRIAAFLAACALAGCRATSGGAYGASGDERLEVATSEKGSTEGSDDASKTQCSDLQKKEKDAMGEDKTESDRLKLMTQLYADAKDRSTKLDDAVAKNPDLVYSEQAEAIKHNVEECRGAFADIRSDFDRFVREICDLPVIQEVQGNNKVNVPRLDFALLRSAITTLDPDDKDALMAKVDLAEKKTGGNKSQKK